MAQSVVTVRLNGLSDGVWARRGSPYRSPPKEVDAIITSLKAEAGQLGDTAIGDGRPYSSRSKTYCPKWDIANQPDSEGEAMLAAQLQAMTKVAYT